MLSLTGQLLHWLTAAGAVVLYTVISRANNGRINSPHIYIECPAFIALLVFIFRQAYRIHQHSGSIIVNYTTALGIATVWLGRVASAINYHFALDPIGAKTKNEIIIHLFLGVVLVSQAEWIRLLLFRNYMFITIHPVFHLNLPFKRNQDYYVSLVVCLLWALLQGVLLMLSNLIIHPRGRSCWGICFKASNTRLTLLFESVLMSPLSLLANTLTFLLSRGILPKETWQEIKYPNQGGDRKWEKIFQEDINIEEGKLTSLNPSSVEALTEKSGEPTKTSMTGNIASTTKEIAGPLVVTAKEVELPTRKSEGEMNVLSRESSI
ncbi:hypothetical protein BU16DRAFT_563423 [Lophium mytilinum]|uniref:Uncharacterized protein n=1 Tax=Lophium mytilinum TaxID=390894 RepID=A0A6A6QND0_9PEZI|nr:hypothetical protein BU16DRAFT_563423 [Lophium mytilinum]